MDIAVTAGAQDVPSVRAQLDIVQDCSDLRGTFPQNVELKFVYWRHGPANNDVANIVYNALRVAPHFTEADYIAMECALIAHASAEDQYKEYSIINDVLQGRTQGQSTAELYGDMPTSTAFTEAVTIAKILKTLGREQAPIFFPVDVMESVSPIQIDYSKGYDLTEAVVEDTADMRRREEVTIRQLHEQATKISADGKPHQIAVLYGVAHTALSVAASELGAPTKRVFVDKPWKFVNMLVERKLRYQPAESLEIEFEQAEQSRLEGLRLGTLAVNLGTIDAPAPGEINTPDQNAISAKLGYLLLVSKLTKLTKPDRAALDHELRIVAPYMQRGTKVPLLKRGKVDRSVRRLITLADRIRT